MKKRILSVLFAMTICLSGCASVESESKSDTSMFVCVEQTSVWRIVYHKDTKVMYAVSDGGYNGGTFTVLLGADGDPMLWEK